MNILFVILAFIASFSHASPYFRPINVYNPNISAGAYVNPFILGQTSTGAELSLVSHSTKDGCILPTVVCEDWSLLSVGVSANSGHAIFGFGPSINLMPVIKVGLVYAINQLTKPEQMCSVKELLSSNKSNVDITGSIGPKWVISPTENWKGYFRLFSGATLHF